MTMSVRNWTTKDEMDTFEVKRCTSMRDGKMIDVGYKVSFGEANITAFEARRLSDWLMRAAQVCDEKNKPKVGKVKGVSE